MRRAKENVKEEALSREALRAEPHYYRGAHPGRNVEDVLGRAPYPVAAMSGDLADENELDAALTQGGVDEAIEHDNENAEVSEEDALDAEEEVADAEELNFDDDDRENDRNELAQVPHTGTLRAERNL